MSSDNLSYRRLGLRDFRRDPSLVLDLPLYKKDGDSFSSDDAYGHLCTVSGATWGSTGRTFNGTTDFITTGKTIQQLGITDKVTVIVWAKKTAPATNDHLFSCANAAGSDMFDLVVVNSKYNLVGAAGVGSISIASSGDIDTNWNMWAGTYGGNNDAVLYINAVSVGTDTSCTGNIGNSGTVMIGVSGDYVGTQLNWGGLIGDVLTYNRALSPSEIMNFYLNTKWRYI
jgi:hypothetical protein